MNIKAFLVFLSRNKGYTAINILGLSLSMMFVILIGVYTWQEFHVNTQFPKADRILVYGLNMCQDSVTRCYSGGNWRLQQHFRARYPEIESSTAIYGGKGFFEVDFWVNGKTFLHFPTMFVDSTFFSIFDIPMLVGDRRTALTDRDCAVVTDDFARRTYGSVEKAMGKRLKMDGMKDGQQLRISGVIPAIKHSSLREADIYVNFENIDLYNPSMTAEHMNNATGAEVVFLERPGAHLEAKTADMDQYQKGFFWIFQGGDIKMHTTLTPLSKFYFKKFDTSMILLHGDKSLVNMLFAVGLVILFFAVFNYINLTNAISDKRAREMAMRRLVGASRRDVVARLIGESVLLCAFSMLIALLLSWGAKPYTERLLNTDLNLGLLLSPAGIALLIAFTALLGIVAGVLPASVISKAKPIDIVRGTYHYRVRQGLSTAFIIIQNTATIALIAMAFAMSSQIRYMLNVDRGYNSRNLIYVPLGGSEKQRMDAWYDGLRQLPQVVDVAACYGTPYNGGNNETFYYQGKTISSQVLVGDSHYMKVFGLKVRNRTGLRNTQGHEVFVNRQMLAEESLPMNSRFYYFNQDNNVVKGNISGLLDDIIMRTLDTEPHPVVLIITDDSLRYRQLATTIQVQGDPVKAYQSVQQVFKKTFGVDLEMDVPYIDQQIEHDYEGEIRMATILRLFAIIAVVISVLGLVAMSTYFIDSRRREIALRKVFGSTSAEVSRRFIRRFLSFVAVAFVIATPIIVYFYGSWVAHYSYRALWWPWILVAGLAVLAICYFAVAMQVHRASRQNPADNLKSE